MMKRYGPRVHDALLVVNPNGYWAPYDDVKAMVKQAKEVARLLELGDQRLRPGARTPPWKNAAVALSPEESAELYQACKKIIAKGEE